MLAKRMAPVRSHVVKTDKGCTSRDETVGCIVMVARRLLAWDFGEHIVSKGTRSIGCAPFTTQRVRLLVDAAKHLKI